MRSIVVPGLVAAAVAVGLAIAAPWASAPAYAAGHGGAVRCAASQFRGQLTGTDRDNTDLYRTIQLTNTGPTCALRGRPVVSMERHGHRIGAPGDYFPYSSNGRPPATGPVRVASHGHAAIWLALAPAGGSSCRRTQLDGFQVGLPASGYFTVSIPGRQRSEFVVCASRTAHLLAYSQFLTHAG